MVLPHSLFQTVSEEVFSETRIQQSASNALYTVYLSPRDPTTAVPKRKI
jgi:hypothetical protein